MRRIFKNKMGNTATWTRDPYKNNLEFPPPPVIFPFFLLIVENILWSFFSRKRLTAHRMYSQGQQCRFRGCDSPPLSPEKGGGEKTNGSALRFVRGVGNLRVQYPQGKSRDAPLTNCFELEVKIVSTWMRPSTWVRVIFKVSLLFELLWN